MLSATTESVNPPGGTGMFVEVELPVLKIKVRGRRFDMSRSVLSSISRPSGAEVYGGVVTNWSSA